MPGEHSVFDGEWWWPKWSDLSSLPLPPDPQQQDPSAVQVFEDDLEKGANVRCSKKWPEPPDPVEEPSLASYPARLLNTAQNRARFEQLDDTSEPIYYFGVLRHYELNLITHKLHRLQTRLEARQSTGLSYEETKELTRLLQDQGIFISSRQPGDVLIKFLKQLQYEIMST
jgi:hypothetical protein